MGLIELREDVRSPRALRVDRKRGIIYDPKLLGWKSANGREYIPAGVDPRLYENRRVNADHSARSRQSEPRSVLDTIGWVTGAHRRKSGVFAKEFHLLNPAGEFEQRLMTAATEAPHLFGFSHVAKGIDKPGSRGTVIESIAEVVSIDLVSDPATTNGLAEGRIVLPSPRHVLRGGGRLEFENSRKRLAFLRGF